MEKKQKICKNCGKEFLPSKDDERIVFCCDSCRTCYRKKTGYMKSYYCENFGKWKSRQSSDSYKDAKNDARKEKYWNDENFREKVKENVKKYYKAHPEKRLAQRVKKYGITADEYSKMLESQNGKCAICGAKTGDNRGNRLYVDHDHASGRTRGLLCYSCNFGIGIFKDDVNLLKRAIEYLEVEI